MVKEADELIIIKDYAYKHDVKLHEFESGSKIIFKWKKNAKNHRENWLFTKVVCLSVYISIQ